MDLGTLVVKLLLERTQFRSELAQTVQDAGAAATRVQGHTAAITGAVADAVGGQTSAVQAATRAMAVFGPVAAGLAAGALAAGAAFYQGAQESRAYEKAITLSGNAAGVTSGQLADMARRMDAVVGTQASAAAALTAMTAGGKVAAENLEKVSLAAIEMERATGQAVGDTEKIFARLGDDPVKASQRLNESMHHLTASTYAQIKAAEDMGDKEAAVSIAQNAAADALRARAAQVEQQLGFLERAWRGVRDVAKEAWDNMLNAGRPDTLSTQIANVRHKIDQAKGLDPNRRFSMPWDTPLADLEQQLAFLTEQERLIRRGTEAQAERNRVQSAGIAAVDALGKANERALTGQERAAKALESYRENLKAVRAAYEQAPSDALGKLLDPDTIAKTEAAIIKSGQERARSSNAAQKELEREAALLANLSGVNADYQAQLKRLQAVRDKGNLSEERYIELVNELIAKQPMAKRWMDEQSKADTAAAKATLELAAARDKAIAAQAKETEKVLASVTAQQEQNARLGLTKEAIAALDAAKLEMLATDLDLQAIKVMDKNLDEQQYDMLRRQAQAYRDLAQAKRDGAAKQAAIDSEKELEKSAKKAAKEGERAAEHIERSLTDSLMRGFESGKDMARSLRDSVVAMFKTMVLRPVVSAIVSPVAGAITGAMGFGSAGQSAAGSMAGSMGTSFLGSALGGIGAFGTGASYGAASLFANGLGTTLTAGTQMIGAGSVMSGLGTIAGALGPIAIGIALLSSLVKKSTPHMGAGATYSAAAGMSAGADQYTTANYGLADTRAYDAQAAATVGAIAKGLATALDATAISFGKTAGYEIATAFADDKSKDGAWGSLVIKRMGETLLDWRDTQTSKWAPREFADGEAGLKEYQAEVTKSVRQVLEGMDLPGWAGRIAAAIPDDATLDQLTQAMGQISAYPAQLLQQFGTTRDEMVQQFAQGLASGNAMGAGQAVADTLVASIQNAVFTNAAGQIFDTVNMGIVAPVLDAIATGASVADALSQATIDATIERAKKQAQALAELYGNADFAAAMEQLRTAVGGALGQAGSYIQTLPQTLVATQQIDTAAQDAARAAEEAQRAWQQITDGLLADQAALQIDLLRAQGREEEALARERALAIEGMDAYQTALYDSNRALRTQIDTLRELGELLPSVIDQYLTPEQRTATAYQSIAADLVAAGLSGAGVGDLAQALVGASKGEIAEAAAAIYNMAGVTDEMRVALLRAAGSLATLKDEAASAASGGLDAAYSALERAVQARRSVVQDTVNDVRAVFDTVRSAARELFGEVDSVVQFNAQAGRAYITQALGAARSTGYLPDGEQLSEAIRAARAGLQGEVFASQAEADYQKLVLANELRELQDISGDQLTEAERQLKALDGILDSARAQIDALRGIDNSVMSVEAALQQFGSALLAATGKSPAAAQAAAGGAASGAAGMPDWATFGVGDWMTSSTGSLVFDNSTGMLYGQGDVTSNRSELRNAAAALLEAGQNQQLYDAVRGSGFTLDQADTILGLPAGEAEKWARSLGLPVFHDGTPYVPRTGFAVLQQGEAVIPRAFNPFTGGGSSGNAELLAELRALREQNARLEAALDRVTNNTGDTATVLASVVRNNALVVDTAPEF